MADGSTVWIDNETLATLDSLREQALGEASRSSIAREAINQLAECELEEADTEVSNNHS